MHVRVLLTLEDLPCSVKFFNTGHVSPCGTIRCSLKCLWEQGSMAAYYRPFRGRISSHAMGMAALCSASILLGIAVLWILYATATQARAERLSMRVYTSADGLASGFINHVMRDSHGFIWFCTRDGLSRFDGYRFTNYKVGDGLTTRTSASSMKAFRVSIGLF